MSIKKLFAIYHPFLNLFLKAHFAFWLHQKPKKVYFVDADAQGSGAIWMSLLSSQISTSRIVDANELIRLIRK